MNNSLIQHSNHSFKEIFMEKITTLIIALSILLNWSCRLEEITVPGCIGDTETTYEKRYNHLKNSFAWDFAETQDGNFIVCGNYNDGQSRIFLMKLNDEGDTLFLKFDENQSNASCRSIVVTQEGDFLICGAKGGKPYFARYDKMGDLSGDLTAPDSGECNCVAPQGIAGRYLFTGRRPAATATQQSAYTGVIGLQGGNISFVDEHKPPIKSSKENTFQVIPTIAGGECAVIGNSFNGDGAPDSTRYMYFYKLNQNLNLIEGTERFYSFNSPSSIGRGIVANADGTYTVGGFMDSNIFMAHLDESGGLITKYDYGGAGDQIYSIIEAHEADNYVMCGLKNGGASTELLLIKISYTGEVIWERTYGQSGTYEAGYSVKRTRDCGYIMTGYSAKTPPTGTFDEPQAYAIKVDSEGRR